MKKIKFTKQNLLIIPYFIFVVLLIIIPIVFILLNSFITPNHAQDYDNWFIWKYLGFWYIFFKSIGIGLLTAFLCLIIGLPYVYILVNLENKSIRYVFLSLIITPLFLFTLVKILALKGMLTLIFDVPINNTSYLILGLVYLNLPFMIIPLYNILSNMPTNIINASQDLGYTKLMTFIKVVIPYGLKAICSGIVIVFLLSIMSVATSNKLLDNAAGNQLIGNLINDLSNPSNPFDMQKASSIVLVTLIFSSIIYFSINLIPVIYRKIKGGIND